MAPNKPTPKPKAPGAKGVTRLPLEDQIVRDRAKLADKELRLKVRTDPALAKKVRQIRGLLKMPQTPVIAAAIKELRAGL